MKVISVWQPYAQLIVLGFKIFETRTWPAPQSIVGHRIGIASTKSIRPEQRAAMADPEFVRHYGALGMPVLEELPHGYLLGTARLDSVELVTEELLADISAEEQSYGWFSLGGYAWRLQSPEPLAYPIPIRGKQGLYDYKGFDNEPQTQNPPQGAR